MFSLTTQPFRIKSLLCHILWNQGAAMPNSVEKGTAVLWLKSSQLKLCFCFGKKKRKKSKTQRRDVPGAGHGRASPGGSPAASVCTRGLARQTRPAGVIGGGRSAPPAPSWRPWSSAGLASRPSPHSHLQPQGASCWEPHVSNVAEYQLRGHMDSCTKALRGLRRSLGNRPGL